MPINYKPIYEWESGFHDWTIRRYPHDTHKQNGFMGGFIFGERGQGKSTYAYKVMAKVYYTLNGYDKKEQEYDAYKEALKYMIYEPEDFQKLTIYNKLHHIVTPIICLDDASMHFGNMLHITNPRQYSSLMGQTATVRTAVTGMLITAPKRCHVVKFIRDYDDFKGEAFIDFGGGDNNWNRKIRFYKWTWYPDETKFRIHIPFQDKYSCYVPDEQYHPYIARKGYFEVKHDMQDADRLSKPNRALFFEYQDMLPSLDGYPDLKKLYIDKWKKEEQDEIEKAKISRAEQIFRTQNITKKLDMIKQNKENMEKVGI